MGEDQAEGWRHACALPPDSAQDTREAKITSAWRHSAPVVARLACPPLDADDESQPSPPRSALLNRGEGSRFSIARGSPRPRLAPSCARRPSEAARSEDG